MTRKRNITSRIPPLPSKSSLECYLAGRFSYLTQSEWRNEIFCGRILLDGLIVADPATPINGGETLAWDGSRNIEPDVDKNISVLYEDECLIAVNKTGNLPVHPSDGISTTHSLPCWKTFTGARCIRHTALIAKHRA